MASSFLKNKAKEQAEKIDKQFGNNAYGGSSSLRTGTKENPSAQSSVPTFNGGDSANRTRASNFLARKARTAAERIDKEYGAGQYGGSSWTALDKENGFNTWLDELIGFSSKVGEDYSAREGTYQSSDILGSYRNEKGTDIEAMLNRANIYKDYFSENMRHYDELYGDGTTEEILQSINEGTKYLSNVRADLDSEYNYWNQWKTEDDYNGYLEQAKEYERLSSYDVEGGKSNLAVLEAQRTQAAQRMLLAQKNISSYSRAGNMPEQLKQANADYAAASRKYNDLDSQISVLRNELHQAENIQTANRYTAYMDEPDFSAYAKQGASIKNPALKDVEKGVTLFGWNPFAEKPNNIVTYSRDNWESIAAGEANNSKMTGRSLYHWMTDDEVNLYNYILSKQGDDAAQTYLDSIEETLNYRLGTIQAENVRNIGGAGEVLMTGLYGLSSGIDQFGSGVRQLFSSERLPTTATQFGSSAIEEGLGGGGKVLYGSTKMVGNMAPGLLLAAVTAGAGAPAAVSGGMLSASVGVSAGGNAYNQALGDGYTKEQARTYGSLVGLSEGALTYLLGGLGKTTGLTAKMLGKVSSIDNALLRIAATGGVRISGEVTEENLQNYLEPAFRTLLFDEDYDAPTFDDFVYTTLVTALTVGILEGRSIASAGRRKSTDLAVREFTQDTIDGYLGEDGIDYFDGIADERELKSKYHELAKVNHPDAGGSAQTMSDINRQYAMRTAFYTVATRASDGAAPTVIAQAAPSATAEKPTDAQSDGDLTVRLVRDGVDRGSADSIASSIQAVVRGEDISGNKAVEIAQNEAAVTLLSELTGIEINTDAPISEVKTAIRSLASRASAANRARVGTDTSATNEALERIMRGYASSGERNAAVQAFDIQRIGEIADTLGKAGAQALTSMYNAETQDAESYFAGMTAYYNAGVNGKSISTVKSDAGRVLNDAQTRAAYLAGQSDASSSQQENLAEPATSGYTGSISNTETEGMENGRQEGNQSGRRGGGRSYGVAPAEPGSVVSGGPEKAQRGTETQRRRAESLRAVVQAQGIVSQSTAGQGISTGTNAKTLRVIPASLYTPEMQTVAQAQREAGRTVTFFTGEMELNGTNGTFRARGAISADGKRIWVRADHDTLTVEQIAKHEEFHALVKKDPELMRRTRDKLIAGRSEAELAEMANAYIDWYGWSDVSIDYVLEEVLADAYAGIDVFEELSSFEGATRFTEDVRRMIDGSKDSSVDLRFNKTKELDRNEQEGKAESRREFQRRMQESGYRGARVRGIEYAYERASALDKSYAAETAKRELNSLGIRTFYHKGLAWNDGQRTYRDDSDACCIAGGVVGIKINAIGNGLEIAGHEAFHHWYGTAGGRAFTDLIIINEIATSPYAVELFTKVANSYLGTNKELSPADYILLYEEYWAAIAGRLHAGIQEAELRSMLTDYDGVKAAWDALVDEHRKTTKNSAEETEPREKFSMERSVKETLGLDIVDGGAMKFSFETWTEEEQARVLDDLLDAGYTRKNANKWIKDVNGIAAIIGKDRQRLDFIAADNHSFLKPNQDYVRTLDASTLCDKRRLYQGTFNAIQHKLPGKVLTSDDLITLKNMLDDAGYKSPCAVCYVESRRRHLGKYAQEFLDSYKGEYKPELNEVTTSDGLEKLRKEHPQAYTDFVNAMNAKGSANPKVVQLRTSYRGDIKELTPGQIKRILEIGGLRVQSFSDFETPHLLDMAQAVLDMAAIGLTSQAYTKFANFAWVFGGTGMKINLSLIAEGNGFDANGNLIFSSKEGMDIDEALRIRKKYGKDVGTIIVGVSDAHILACMADKRIDFIIPFHRSGWGKAELAAMHLDTIADYTYGQNEHDLTKPTKRVKGEQQYALMESGNLYPADYWDYTKSGKKNAEYYLELCAEQKRQPKFSQFLVNNGDGSYSLQPDGSTDGYWKTIIDFKMYDNAGRGAPQRVVQPTINMTEAKRVLSEYEGNANELPVATDVVDSFVERIQEKFSQETGRRDKDAPVSQGISSAKTSIKQVPALFKDKNTRFGDTNIDIGGGRFDLATNYLASIGTQNMVFDPYNRTADENSATLLYLQSGKRADTATCANVLNVIAEPAARANVILEAAKAVKADGTAYFMVYEGDGTGTGKETSAGWQNNRKTADYLSEIGEYFDSVQKKGKLIIATDPKADLPKAAWETTPGEAVLFSRETPALSAAEMEQKLNDLRQERDGVLEELDSDIFGALSDAQRKKLVNRLAKLYHDIGALVVKEGNATVKTPLRTIRDNLGEYRRSDLESLAEQISDGNWDGYEELSRFDLEFALTEELDRLMGDMNVLEAQAPKFGLYVRQFPAEGYSTESESIKELREQNEALRGRVDYWRQQTKRTGRQTLRQGDLDKFARGIIKGYQSELKVSDIRQELKELGEYIVNGAQNGDELSYSEVKRRAMSIARAVIGNASALVNIGDAETYRDIKAYFRGTSLSFEDKGDIADWADFRKRNFGRFIISKNGLPVDVAYQELTEMFGEVYFPSEITHPTDQLLHIADLFDKMRPIYENPHSYFMAEATEYCANDIIDGLISEGVRQTPPTFADRQAAKLDNEISKTAAAKQETKDAVSAGREAEKAAFLSGQMNQGAKMAKEMRTAKERSDKRIAAAKQALANEQTRRREQLDALKEHYRKKEEKARQSRIASALRSKIMRHVKELSGKLLKPSDKNHVPESLREPVAALLNSINLESTYGINDETGQRVYDGTGTPTKRTAAFTALRAQYREIEEGRGDYSLVIDPDLVDNLDAVIEMKDTRLADMNVKQLQTIWQTIRAIEASITSANRMLGQSRYETISDMAEALRQHYDGFKTRQNLSGLIGGVQKFISTEMLKPVDYMHRLGKAGDALWQELRGAQDSYVKRIAEAERDMTAVIGNADIRNWGGKKAPITTFTTESGDSIGLTPAQVMELYLLMKRPQALQHILKGGIRQAPVERKGWKLAEGSAPAHVTINDLESIIGTLTAEQTRIADELGKYASGVLSGWGNEASMNVYGYRKFTEDHYWPIRSDPSYTKSESGKGVDVTIKGRGFTKQTVRHANNAIMIGDALDTFAQHVNDMATYSSWLAAIEDAERLKNFRYRNDEGDTVGSVKETINRVLGSAGTEYLDLLIEDINQGVKTKSDSFNLSRFTANYKAAAVGANFRVIVQQPTALLRAAAIIDPKYLGAGALRKSNWELVKKWAPIAQWKDWGYFELDNGRLIKDILLGTDSVLDRVRQASMTPAGKADSITWCKIWAACEAEMLDTNKELKDGTDEFYKAVAVRFNEIIDRSQVVDGILQRNQTMRSSSDLVRMVTSFMSEPVTAVSMLSSALYDATRTQGVTARGKAKKRLARTITAVLMADVLCAAVASLVDALRDDDKEKDYWQKWAEAFTGITGDEENFDDYIKSILSGNLFGQVNIAAKIPFAKDAFSLLGGFSITRMDMEIVSKFLQNARRMLKALSGEGSATIGSAVADLIASSARFIGLPVANVKRDLTGLINTTLSAIGNWDLMYQADKLLYSVNSSDNKGHYYDIAFYAWQEEDRTQYNAICADLISHGYTQKDIDNAVRTRLKKTEQFTGATGERLEGITADLEKSTGFKGLPEGYQAKALASASEYATATTMREQDEDYALPSTYSWIDKADAGAGVGVETWEYILFRTALQMEADDGSLKQEEVIDALVGMSWLSNEERDYLFGTRYESDKNNPWA